MIVQNDWLSDIKNSIAAITTMPFFHEIEGLGFRETGSTGSIGSEVSTGVVRCIK